MINLSKGDAPASLAKSASIRARCSWSSNTDYDLYALVLYADGHVETVATFGANGVPAQMATTDGAVKHLGDVGRGVQGTAEEIVEITLTDDVRAVVPVAYSAQSNGTGSFRRYAVSLEVDNGQGGKVVIDASHANDSETIYTCVPGMIENTPGGVLVHALEQYSAPSSENRPAIKTGGAFRKDSIRIVMDAGPCNNFK